MTVPVAAPTPVTALVEPAIVAACDRRPGLVALTGRASQNVVAWSNSAAIPRPMIAYLVHDAVRVGARWTVPVSFAAVAAAPGEEARCAAMLAEIVAGCDARTFAALAAPVGPLDAITTDPTFPSVPAEEGQSRADLTLTLTVWP